MSRLVVFLMLASLVGLVMTNRISLSSLDPRSVGTTFEDRQVIRTSNQVEARFSRVGSIDETYMLFGGDARQRPNQLTHAHLAGLPMRYARQIASQYPDFHRCKSPGAAQAQRFLEPTNFVAADRSTRATLVHALDLFEDRLREGGDRTCIRIRGSELSMDSARAIEDDQDLSSQLIPAYSKSRIVLAEEASIEDCQALMR